jgi:hypothetical protein
MYARPARHTPAPPKTYTPTLGIHSGATSADCAGAPWTRGALPAAHPRRYARHMNKADLLLLTIERDVQKHMFTAYVPAGDAPEVIRQVLDLCAGKGWTVATGPTYYLVALPEVTPEELAKHRADVEARFGLRS